MGNNKVYPGFLACLQCVGCSIGIGLLIKCNYVCILNLLVVDYNNYDYLFNLLLLLDMLGFN